MADHCSVEIHLPTVEPAANLDAITVLRPLRLPAHLLLATPLLIHLSLGMMADAARTLRELLAMLMVLMVAAARHMGMLSMIIIESSLTCQ